jgi:hypothetical protein
MHNLNRGKRSPKMWATCIILWRKQSLIWRKFAQSGHPVYRLPCDACLFFVLARHSCRCRHFISTFPAWLTARMSTPKLFRILSATIFVVIAALDRLSRLLLNVFYDPEISTYLTGFNQMPSERSVSPAILVLNLQRRSVRVTRFYLWKSHPKVRPTNISSNLIHNFSAKKEVQT